MSQNICENKWEISVVDALAFYETLYGANNENHVEVVYSKGGCHARYLTCIMTRENYDDNGFHVGSTDWKVSWELIKKSKLGISGFPKELSAYVIVPSNFKIRRVWNPKNTKYFYPPDSDFLHSETSWKIRHFLDRLENVLFNNGSWEVGYWSFNYMDCVISDSPFAPPEIIAKNRVSKSSWAPKPALGSKK